MMKLKLILAAALTMLAALAQAQNRQSATITLHPEEAQHTIAPEIYGQFAEHLGACIYGGIWVGEDSPIPNTNGYRNDVLQAFRDLQIPVLRWPGGCFADEYHWVDGIGPRSERPRMVNTNWGGTVEDNSFGTHEFLNLCEMLGIQPYISGNVGSGTVEELAKWVEYMTAEDGPQAKLRKQNGREKPWKVKYLGVGNESWGCGGDQLPEFYADNYRRYAVYCRNFNDNKLYKIASGASDYDYNWTEVMMKKIGSKMHGLSLHYYTVLGWDESKGFATQFTDDDYYWTLGKCLEIEEIVKRHCAVMDKYDPKKRIALLVDEWGTWWEVEPGTNPGHLYQQNTMRDAMVAALSLNVFHKYVDRGKMTNIAQIANVLQSMVLTKDDQMVLTPTYHVFKMYKVHQGATMIPLDVTCANRELPHRKSIHYDGSVPTISATASRRTGEVNISLANTDLKADCDLEIALGDIKAKSVKAEILNASDIHAHNDFGSANNVHTATFTGAKLAKGKLTVRVPAHSIITLTIAE